MKITPLKQKRQEEGLTQEELASRSRKSTRIYKDYEAGKRTPNVHTAIRLADELGTETYEGFKALFPLPGEERPSK